MFSKKELLNSKEIYLSKNDEIMVAVPDRNVGYVYSKSNLMWNVTKRYYSWKVWHKQITSDEAIKIMEQWQFDADDDINKLNIAINFATERHAGQFRKGTTIPYIVHPIEVLQILYSMRADTNLLIAGVLHDTVEDTDTTIEEIKDVFGNDVAMLVASNSEDKSKSWIERKQHTIDSLANADTRVQMLIMADKVSNIRSIAYDYKNIGDKLWERFNAPKEKQAWYYSGIQDSLYDLQYVPECETVYWEFVSLFKDVFVKFYYDEQNEIIYQVCQNEIYCFEKNNLQWVDYKEKLAGKIADDLNNTQRNYYTMQISETAKQVERKLAELIEDCWTYKIK